MHNNSALVDYPFRIFIIVIILAITIPAILYGLDYYTRLHKENDMHREVDRLADAIIQVYNQGIHAQLVLEVDFPEETDYVIIGGSLEEHDRYIIRYRLEGGSEHVHIVKERNRAIQMTADGYGGLRIGGRTTTIVITKMVDEGDLDGDGDSDEFYIQVTAS
jgi:hypothetical protein